MSNHTPVPWTYRHTAASAFSACWVIEAPTRCVAKVVTAEDEDEEANAQFIVRACNAHDDLVEACKAMVHAAVQGDSALGGVATTLAEAAIAKAKETES